MSWKKGGATALLLLLTYFITFPVLASRPEPGHPAASRQARVVRTETVPGYARDTFVYVLKHGRAPRGYEGGRLWQNREHRLPARGDYREYDVHPKVEGVNRGAERIIVDLTAHRGWYTNDHYRTFMPMGAQ
jgi:guanyl-specific ribonuclease Sa